MYIYIYVRVCAIQKVLEAVVNEVVEKNNNILLLVYYYKYSSINTSIGMRGEVEVYL